MNIKKIFLPNSCLQGSKIASYILWSKETELHISIKIPQEFELIETYNCNKTEQNGSSGVLFSGFEENGYLGLMFESKIIEKIRKDVIFNFSFVNRNGEELNEKRIVHLFRPNIENVSFPSKIDVSIESGGICSLSNLISFSNTGEGMAVVGIKVADTSEIGLKKPKGMNDFIKNVWSDIASGLEKIKPTYTNYDEEISEFIFLGTFLMDHLYEEIDPEIIGKKLTVIDNMEEILLSDIGFSEVFMGILVNSYLKNFHFITDLETFFNYLKSIEIRKIILINPLEALELKSLSGSIVGELVVFDLNGKEYPSIPFKIEINCKKECELSVHNLIDMNFMEVA